MCLATVLVLYQLLYWIYLLALGEYWFVAAFPYGIFTLSVMTQYSWGVRALLVGAMAYVHYDALFGGQEGALDRRLLLAWLCAALLFTAFDRCFQVFMAPFAFPILLCLVMVLPVCRRGHGLVMVGGSSRHAHSLALPTKTGKLIISNPQRGIYILGNQGSGKTHFVMEPILYHCIQQGYAGIVYDYDFEGTPAAPDKGYCLSKFVYNCFLEHQPKGVQFQLVNFTDMHRTRRINPFASSYIQDRAYLEEYVNVLLKNLVPEASGGKNFWLNSTQVLLKSLFVFLDNRHPGYCTLPHALALATQPVGDVLATIRQDEEASAYTSSVLDALDAGGRATAQLSGITATLKVSLQLLLHPHLFWVLSGDEVPLSVNAPHAPMLLCIGNHPPAKAAYSPIIALLMTTCFKAMYGHGRVQSFVAIDELPTLLLPDLAELPATARKYGISTIACLQSNAQLEASYGMLEAQKIQQTLVNKFIGNSEDGSAKYGSNLLGKEDKALRGSSISSSMHQSGDTETRGEGVQWQERARLSPQALMGFSPGEFTGKLAERTPPFFHAQLRAVSSYNKRFRNGALEELPCLGEVDKAAVTANYQRIWAEAKGVLARGQG